MSLTKGQPLPPFTLRIERADVNAYLDATGESPERWAGIVPPLAVGALALGALLDEIAPPAGLVHTNQELDFIAAVPVGALLEGEFTVNQRATRRGTMFTTFGITIRTGGNVALRGSATVVLAVDEGGSA
jgi:hypothetical protein